MRNDLKIRQNREVVKHNDAIRKLRCNLSIQEQKLLAYIVSELRIEDTITGKPIKEITIEIADYLNVCGLTDAGKNYSDLKSALRRLKTPVWAKTGVEDWEQLYQWFDTVKISKRNGRAVVKFSEDVKPFIYGLKNNFTQYQLKYVLDLHSKYSFDLYEYIKSWEFAEKTYIVLELDELKRQLNAENYKQWKDFKTRVLDPACEDISKYTDIFLKYKPLKVEGKGKKYAKISFTPIPKNIEELAKMERNINGEIKPDQYSLFPKSDPLSKVLRGEYEKQVETELKQQADATKDALEQIKGVKE